MERNVLKRKVYDYILVNPCTTVHRCARALKVEELVVLELIEELCKEGVVSVGAVLPLDNDIDPDTSTFYSVCGEYDKRRRHRNGLTRKDLANKDA